MGVEVYECFQIFVRIGVLSHDVFGSPYSGLIFLARVAIKTVQVLAEGVKAIVPACHTIRVKHGNNLKNIVLPQEPALLTF